MHNYGRKHISTGVILAEAAHDRIPENSGGGGGGIGGGGDSSSSSSSSSS